MEVSFCCSFLLLACVSSPWCPSMGTSTGCGPFRDVPAPVWRVSFQECISSCVHNSCPLLHASLCLFEHSVTCLLLQFFTFAAPGSFSLSQINWSRGTVCSSDELEDGRQWLHGASWNWTWPTQGSLWPPPVQPRYQNLHFVPSMLLCQLGDTGRKVLSMLNYRNSTFLLYT